MSAEMTYQAVGDFKVNDLVKIGKGRQTYEIRAFGRFAGGEWYAVLLPIGGYTRSSATLDRLTKVG